MPFTTESTANRVALLFTSAPPTLANAPLKLREAEDLTANAQAVARALRSLGYPVRCFAFDGEPGEVASQLQTYRPRVVFNLAEGPQGCYEKEAHAVALLELLHLLYTGNGPFALSLCKNKAMAKEILQARGVPTPRFLVCNGPPPKRLSLTFPLVVKPLRQDGSIGITEKSVVNTHKELQQGVEYVLNTWRQEALVEEFMSGREIQISVLGNGTAVDPYRVLPPSEYVYHSPQWRVCSFDAKWDEDHPSYAAVEAVNPAKVSARLLGELERITIQCARIFDLSGYARVDFRLNHRGVPHVLEVNPNPDLAPRMGLARAAETAGLSFAALVQEILRLGLAKGVR